MGRICSIHQPSYWPYLGLFDKIQRSDVFVFLDDVQFIKNEFKNRNRAFVQSVRAADATRVDWLTVPVRQVQMAQTIRDTQVINPAQVFRKHLATLSQAYGQTPGFQMLRADLEQLYRDLSHDPLSLADLNAAVTRFALGRFGIQTEIFGMSSAIREKSDDPTQRLIDICKHLGADTYLAGVGGKSYMNADEFEKQGIRLLWQEWHPFPYRQRHSPETFVPYLACFDLLFNEGAGAATHFSSTASHV